MLISSNVNVAAIKHSEDKYLQEIKEGNKKLQEYLSDCHRQSKEKDQQLEHIVKTNIEIKRTNITPQKPIHQKLPSARETLEAKGLYPLSKAASPPPRLSPGIQHFPTTPALSTPTVTLRSPAPSFKDTEQFKEKGRIPTDSRVFSPSAKLNTGIQQFGTSPILLNPTEEKGGGGIVDMMEVFSPRAQ